MPDGNVSIDFKESGSTDSFRNISTWQREIEESYPIKLELSESVQVSLEGPQFIHGYVAHDFRTEASLVFQLQARARQFSSFILLLGTISGRNTFECAEAILLQDKDQLIIPLLLETIPSAKEFRDAIASLSPEQKRFAQQFREMQLASTVFAIAVIQTRPHLERVLNLDAGSITKKIQLTHDLMSLFTEHQIPSDVLSYDPKTASATSDAKVSQVAENVLAVQKMVTSMQDKELEQKLTSRKAKGQRPESSDDSMREGCSPPMQDYQMVTQSMQAMPMVGSAVPKTRSLFQTATAPMVVPMPSKMSMSGPPSPMPHPAPSAPVATSAPPQPSGQQQTPEQQPIDTADEDELATTFSAIPKKIDSLFETHDRDNNVRPTVIKSGPEWELTSYDKVTREEKVTKIRESKDKTCRKQQVMDLLDALSRSGELGIQECSVHVVYAVTNAFNESCFDTIAKKSVNPIERMERASLVVSHAIHDTPSTDMLEPKFTSEIKMHSQSLFT
jgi:hypothetical protein